MRIMYNRALGIFFFSHDLNTIRHFDVRDSIVTSSPQESLLRRKNDSQSIATRDLRQVGKQSFFLSLSAYSLLIFSMSITAHHPNREIILSDLGRSDNFLHLKERMQKTRLPRQEGFGETLSLSDCPNGKELGFIQANRVRNFW